MGCLDCRVLLVGLASPVQPALWAPLELQEDRVAMASLVQREPADTVESRDPLEYLDPQV
jgi:hypothetical protein